MLYPDQRDIEKLRNVCCLSTEYHKVDFVY
jgi:hypothetical protein